jgi:hypothetical protein
MSRAFLSSNKSGENSDLRRACVIEEASGMLAWGPEAGL